MVYRDPAADGLPGLVGMHDHIFYSASNALQRGGGSILEPGVLVAEIAFTAPRLYLAAGVTTLRTTGSIDPYTDIKVQSRIETGLMPGPRIYLTSPEFVVNEARLQGSNPASAAWMFLNSSLSQMR